jgi:phage terminase large subunit-like protein
LPSRKRKKSSTSSPSSPQNVECPDPIEAGVSRHVEIGLQYARDVVAGKILACKWIRLACQRQLNDLERAARGEFPFVFDESRAARVCRFIEQLPHTKGEWAARQEKIRLEPWQCFGLTTIFGWVRRSDPTIRRFRVVFVLIPRKNAKSTKAAGIGNYMFAADGEFGAEVYAGATCQRQAWEVFRPAKLMVERTPRLKEAFQIHVGAKNLARLSDGSRFEPVVGKPGDGASPSCAIVDEYHEHRTDELVDTMRTGMGARKQPLLVIITTAGSNTAGPCHAMQRDVERVLEGIIQSEETFGLIYTIDEGDDWTSEEALIKANPNYGVSVSAEFLRSEQAAAIQSTRKQNVFLTKHLNVWVGANTAWMNMQRWKTLGDATLQPEDFIGEPCFAAADLSSKLDITARLLVFRKEIEGADHFYIFGRYYVPAERLKEPELEHYRTWALSGHLQTTPGSVIDYDKITQDTIADIRKYAVVEFGFDPWNAEQYAQTIAKQTSAQVIEVANQVRTLSEPMKQLEALVIDGRLHHDGNPVLTWMMSSVVAHRDAKDNIFPRKEQFANKIDGAVALIMALSRAVLPDSGSVYEHRGLLVLG